MPIATVQRWFTRYRVLRLLAVGLAILAPVLLVIVAGGSNRLVSVTFYAVLVVAFVTAQGIRVRRARLDRHRTRFANRVCPECHYPLAALDPTGLCPECGRTYTHRDVEEHWERIEDAARREPDNPYERDA